MIDAELLSILACPACKQPVELKDLSDADGTSRQWLVCKSCGRQYPIRDGIPIMLIDEARMG